MKIAFIVGVVTALASFAAHAQTLPKTTPDAFKPLAFMAGSCWEGPLPDFVGASTGVGAQTLSHCVRWRLEDQVMTDTLHLNALTPPVRGETNYYWDAETKTLRYIFWSIAGSYSTGTVKTDGKRIVFDDERLFGGKGVVHFTTTWEQTGPDSYVQNRQRQNADGTWTNSAVATFVRKQLK
jgi:hypothetical protein